MGKLERKYLAHFIEPTFNTKDSSSATASNTWERLGKDLEEFSIELNPDVEVTKNILGEQTVNHSGYEVQSDADPFYARSDDALFTQLQKIVDERADGDQCKTLVVDILFDEGVLDPTSTGFKDEIECSGYIEEAYVVPSSYGGDTSGVQIPFTVYRAGNRVSKDFKYTISTKTLVISGT